MLGGGFGSIDTMIKTLRSNANLLRKRKVLEKVKDYNRALKGLKYEDDKKASESVLKEIREKTLKENRRQLWKQTLIIILSFMIIASLATLFLLGVFRA